MGVFHSEGIVLRSRIFGEADKILTILTKDNGKIEAVARGARRPRNRLVGASQQFSYLRVLIFEGKSIAQLSQAEIIRSFSTLRDDLVKMAYAAWWSELIDVFLPLAEVNPGVFRFLLAGLLVLEKAEEPALVSRAFELRLLKYFGFQPSLDVCARCNRAVERAIAGFSIEEGGVFCPRCYQEQPVQLLPLAGSSLQLLRDLYQADLRVVPQWTPEEKNQIEIGRLLFAFIEYLAEKPLKSLSFLQSLLAWT
ncbi:MAG: DNA repair protein RecO [Firmicutes bacterium]|nr:DNA repair protein RecO [Bacillota bacterium]